MAAAFAFSMDGRRAAISWGAFVEVWDVDGSARVTRLALDEKTWSVALSQDGSRILCGEPAAAVYAVDGHKLGVIPVGHRVVASPDGARLLTSEKLDPSLGPELLTIPS